MLNGAAAWWVGSATVLVETEQTADHPGLPMEVLFRNPQHLPLRIICTASIPAITAQAVAKVRGRRMAHNRRLMWRWSDSMRLFE